MKEYWFTELGYFTEGVMKAVKKKMDGKTFMNFNVGWSNCAGNCVLFVKSEKDMPEDEVKNMFLHVLIDVVSEEE